MFDNCVTVNDYIEEIFRAGLKESESKVIDGSEINGYYLSVKSCQNSKVKKLNQWQRLIINIKSKSKKVYGETDTENTFADCMLYAYEALLEILSGENENFPIESDIKTLTTNVRRLILKFTEQKKENTELYAMVDERDKQIAELQKRLSEAEKKYNALMTAKMLTIADTDIENTRKKVNKLIRTVNQCITLLSEKQ